MKNWKNEKENLSAAVAKSISWAETARNLNLKAAGGNYRQMQKYCKYFGIDTSHFLGQSHLKGKKFPNAPVKFKTEELLVSNSMQGTKGLKTRIRKENLLSWKCAVCNINSWEGKELSLQLDHINGINDDNRLENLRFLCPNCHSQTDTYCGRNIRTGKL